ncbi:MAG: ATP-binding protein [Phycisphaerales bacterium]
MLSKPPSQLTIADIHALVENGESEQRSLDFKENRLGNRDKDMREWRLDAVAMANTLGGDLIFGVVDEVGIAKAAPGFECADMDKEILRIEQILRTNIEPPLPPVESSGVRLDNGRWVLVVRVPRSWNGPHCVKLNEAYRMPMRNSRGKHNLDAGQMKDAFMNAASIPERIRTWIEARMDRVRQGVYPDMLSGALLICHCVPYATFLNNIRLPASRLADHRDHFHPPFGSHREWRINADGLLWASHPGNPSSKHGVVRVFRYGMIEAFQSIQIQEGEPRVVPGMRLEECLLLWMRRFLSGLRALDVPAPVVVTASLYHARRLHLTHNGAIHGDFHPIDRDEVPLSDVFFETHEQPVDQTMRPLMDEDSLLSFTSLLDRVIRLGADDYGGEDDDALLTLLHEAAELLPRVEASNMRGVRLLREDEEHIPEAIAVELGEHGEIADERVTLAAAERVPEF